MVDKNRKPFVGSGRQKEGGVLTLRKQDFNAHQFGNGFRHAANAIDMDPVLSGSLSGQTVQETLEKTSSLLDSAGQGFITIGDGYDKADFDVGSAETPSLRDAFIAAFDHDRLQNGGVVLVKAGTYRLSSSVTVPQGITIMGEPSGTIISGETSEQPMFIISEAKNPPTLGSFNSSDITAENSSQFNKFYNIIFADNLDGYVKSGGEAITTMATVPMVDCKAGSYTIFERVSFLGRTNDPPPLTSTKRAISNSGSSAKPTLLFVFGCYFDGLESAIEFIPKKGSDDNLRVEKCRIRYLGDTGNDENSAAISLNLTNANIEGNYIIGEGSFEANKAIFIKNTSVSNTDVRINLLNNTGGLRNSTEQNEVENFFVDSSGQSYESLNFANNWGLNYNNPWFFTVGDGTNSVGDLIGPGAIDLALARAEANSGSRSEITAIVNPGNYTVTRSGSSNQKLNLLGNIRNGNRPVLTINANGATDAISRNTIFLGRKVENIHFKGDNSTFDSITLADPGSDEWDMEVKGCFFEGVGLIVSDNISAIGGTVDFNGIALTGKELSLFVENSHFTQEGFSVADNISFLAPSSLSLIKLSGCLFDGKGYAIGIGDGGAFTTSEAGNSQYIIEDCNFDTSSSSPNITTTSPISSKSHYIWVQAPKASLFIRNVKLTSINPVFFDETVPVDTSILDTNNFFRYIDLRAESIRMENIIAFGPYQEFQDVSTAIDHSLPTFFLRPDRYLSISNCEIGGSLPVQVSDDAFSDPERSLDDKGGYVGILNSRLFSYFNSTGADIGTTICDLDLPRITATEEGDARANISIDNCQFDNGARPDTYKIARHINVTGASYQVVAGVQIYAPEWYAAFSNNTVRIEYPNNLNASSIDSNLDGQAALTVFLRPGGEGFGTVHNNYLFFNCDGYTGTASDFYTTFNVSTWRFNITNNDVQYITSRNSEDTVGRHFLRAFASEKSVISGNIFKNTGTLSGAAITLPSTTTTGLLVNNTFENIFPTNSTVSGPELFSDSSSDKWLIQNNKGQQDQAIITGATGTVTLNSEVPTDTTDISDIRRTEDTTVTPSSASKEGAIAVTHAGNSQVAVVDWIIPLVDVLPFGVTITEIGVVINDTTDSWSFGTAEYIISFSGSDFVLQSDDLNVGTNFPGKAFDTSDFDSAGISDHRLLPNSPFNFIIRLSLSSATVETVSISRVRIRYIW